MSEPSYRTSPVDSSEMPTGIPYIISNEAAERFSFYGMKCILTIFMTEYLLNRAGEPAYMSDGDAKASVHMFVTFVYFTPLLGALLSDWLWGKYRTILYLSLVYCLGHFVLAMDETRLGLMLGLTLISIGAGGIKPCVSAHVGDQFGQSNLHLMGQTFSWFYLSINIGAFISTMLTPVLLKWYGPGLAFGVPGFLMAVATLAFWMGRNQFIHIPAKGDQLWHELRSPQVIKAFLSLTPVYILVAFFWAVFDQTASAWVLQAKKMEHQVGEFSIFGTKLNELSGFPETLANAEILDSQMQAVNPLLILTFIPLVTLFVYPAINRFFPLTAMRKMSIGMCLTVVAALITTWIQIEIDNSAPGTVHILWQIVPYIILTLAEVLVSITCLEFSYTQAPNSIKSIVMSVYLLSVALGNFIVVMVNKFNTSQDGSEYLQGADYYWLFTGMVAVAAIAFCIVARFYREEKYVQGSE